MKRESFLSRVLKIFSVQPRTLPGTSVEYATSAEMTADQKRYIYTHEPMIFGAINKIADDIFREGWEVVNADGSPLTDSEQDIINEFDVSADIVRVMTEACKNAYIYGDGFIELVFDEDEGRTADKEPMGELASLHIISNETITKIDNGFYVQQFGAEEIHIHPARVVHVKIHPVSNSNFGLSVLLPLKNIATSKINSDIVHGEILYRHGTGFLDISIHGMTPEEKDAVTEMMEHSTAPRYFVHNEDYVVQVVNPSTIDPAPYDAYFYTNIARALKMPVSVLTGINTGEIKGSEIEKREYYQNIAGLQKSIFTSVLRYIYSVLLNGLNVDIEWNPIFIDELSEADILNKRVQSAVDAIGALIITENEAREIINEGRINLDIIEENNEEG